MKDTKFQFFLLLMLIFLIILGGILNEFILPLFLGFYYALVLIYGFYVFDFTFEVNFKRLHYILMFLIAFSGPGLIIIFFRFSNYVDKFFHFFHAFLFSFIVFFVISKLKINKVHALILTFFIVSSSFAIFEIIEYSSDKIWDFKLQGSYSRNFYGNVKTDVIINPLDDTMIDLVMSFLGALSYLFLELIKNKNYI
ncbi:MAG: hypothetical protein AABW83_01995 [Nanoarchaeota archaeon]